MSDIGYNWRFRTVTVVSVLGEKLISHPAKVEQKKTYKTAGLSDRIM